MDGVPPYVLWSEVIRNYLEDCNPEQLYRVVGYYPSEVCKLVPDLANRLRAVPPSVPISPEHERDRLFEAVSQFVTNISREAPLLVVLDDLQWTDQSSLLLMHYLARGVYRAPMLILGAYRDTDIDEKHVLTSVLTELNRERLLKSLSLKRMSLDDASEMVKRLLDQDDVPAEFCELVYEKTRGNPFFVEEVIKSLKEEEVISRKENQWKVREVSKIEFPKTVKSVIKARVGRLDDECQNVLTLASFVGNDFSFESLCGVTGLAEDKVLDLMEQMLKTGLVKERVIRGQDVYSFADIIVRDVVHDEVSHLRHKKLHGTVGRALEKVYEKNIDEHLGELAWHFLEFGDEEKALEYFLKAGDRAAEIYANNEAVSYFQHALTLLEKKEGELREKARVLEKLGNIKSLGGEYDVSARYWNEAMELWSQLREDESVARLHRKMAYRLWENKGDAVKAEEHYNKALAILEGKPESVELASLYEDIAHMYYRTKNMAKARSLAEKALELGKKLNDYQVIVNSYVSLGTVFDNLGDRKKAVECHERALRIALDNGLFEAALRGYNNLAVALPTEESERAREITEKGYELAKKIGHIHLQSFIGTNIAWYYLGTGDVKKALTLVDESVALDRKSGDMVNLSFSLGTLALAYFVVGDWNKSEEYVKENIRITEKLNDRQQIVGLYNWNGFLHFSKGEHREAKALMEKAYEVDEKAGATRGQIGTSVNLIWMLIEVGELERAKNLLEKLYEYASKVKDSELIAWADARKGMMFRAEKQWEDSIQYFEKSIREAEALGFRKYRAYEFARMFLCEYARVYLERNQEGDREKAHSLLNQALEMFEKMEAMKEIENIIAKKKLLTA
jgi:adenylate cyclase